MSKVEIEFNPDTGLSFYRLESGERTLLHNVEVGTLKLMSMSDLDYCIATNAFIEMKGLQRIFQEYIWSDDGEIEPAKRRDEPR